MENRLVFKYASAYDATALAALAVAVATRVGSGYKPFLHPNVNFNNVTVRGLDADPDISVEDTTGAGAGTASGDILPTNVTLCFTLRTAFGGRSFRGRFYALPTGTGNLSGVDVFSTTYTAGIVTLLEDIKTDAAAAGWTMVIASRYHDKVKRAVAVTTAVTSIEARNRIVDSMRGRLPVGH